MSRTTFHTVQVQFGDCDPAGIVFFPNFSRWMDAASLGFFAECGVPPWRELEASRGIVGTPLLEITTKFLLSATYGETLRIETTVEEWREKVFVQRHRVVRPGTDGRADLVCEGRELRIFVRRDEHEPRRLRSIPVPADIRALCG